MYFIIVLLILVGAFGEWMVIGEMISRRILRSTDHWMFNEWVDFQIVVAWPVLLRRCRKIKGVGNILLPLWGDWIIWHCKHVFSRNP